MQLGVGQLPEHEVADAVLAGRSHEEIRVRHVSGEEQIGEGFLVELVRIHLSGPHALREQAAARTISSRPPYEIMRLRRSATPPGRFAHDRVHGTPGLVVDALQIAQNAHLDALPPQLGAFATRVELEGAP